MSESSDVVYEFERDENLSELSEVTLTVGGRAYAPQPDPDGVVRTSDPAEAQALSISGIYKPAGESVSDEPEIEDESAQSEPGQLTTKQDNEPQGD